MNKETLNRKEWDFVETTKILNQDWTSRAWLAQNERGECFFDDLYKGIFEEFCNES